MDPSLDPSVPLAAQTAVASPAVAAATAAVTASVATPVQLAVQNHPTYTEMISAAITALNEREGSSKRAIAKYIETNYSDLPPTHSALLTHHLKRLKSIGELLMVKHSYTLPGLRSAPPAVNGTVNVESADPASTVTKRRPGRPPKPKPEALQVALPVFPPAINMNDVPVLPPELPANIAPLPENSHIAAAPANGAATAAPVRGRGRPPKQSGVKRGRGRPPKSGGGGAGGSGSGRGRPKKNAAPAAALAPPAPAVRREGTGRPRGRPPKPINVVEGPSNVAPLSDGVAVAPPVVSPVSGKRRGRPRKYENEAKKLRIVPALVQMGVRNLSGRPRGRPRKNGSSSSAAAAARTQDSQLLVAYLDLKAKLENLQAMVKHTATFIRPSLNSEAAINAIQELELVAMNVSAPPIVQPQQQPVPEQAQPQS